MPSPAPSTLARLRAPCEDGERHYQVLSPEMCSYPMYEPAEPFRCWGIYLAKNAKDAIRQAVADEAFREWVQEARGDHVPPFKGLKATRTLCEHGRCWACECDDDDVPTCPECTAAWAERDALEALNV